jgi:hypothetical protein
MSRRSRSRAVASACLTVAAAAAGLIACGGATGLLDSLVDDAGPGSGPTPKTTPVATDNADEGGSATDAAPMADVGASDVNAFVEVGPPPHPIDVVSTCAQYENVPVGSYIEQANYWNEGNCPGTECMAINTATGAFSVTQAPNCGSTVSSYPNTLYGSSFGSTSPGSALPMQVGALTSVTSSWAFSVGGVSTDQYDVAYDIWFCTNDACGPSGFSGGTELMIWLDYQNTTGWEQDLGSVTLAGYNWEVWTFIQGAAGNTWTYLAYLIQPSSVTSVTNLDLLAFFRDAESRGYIQSSWYLYAIQAGDEIRTGGLPFDSNTFSVSVN